MTSRFGLSRLSLTLRAEPRSLLFGVLGFAGGLLGLRSGDLLNRQHHGEGQASPIGAGGAEGAIDASNILKPALARGEIQILGATTITEYRKYVEKDAALERRFQPVTVEEPGEEQTVAILKGLRGKYEAHHHVKITDEAVEAAVRLSARYINDRFCRIRQLI